MTDDIIPDDKDWTWVLDRACPECGFDSRTVEVSRVGGAIRENALGWKAVLSGLAEDLRARPGPGRWSALEYAAHVRDVHILYLERLQMMLEQDNPLYPNWDQDATAVEQRYRDQDPAAVEAELVAAADALATAFEAVDGDDWNRLGRRGDGAEFTVATFALYMIHDPIHHLWDVTAPRPG